MPPEESCRNPPRPSSRLPSGAVRTPSTTTRVPSAAARAAATVRRGSGLGVAVGDGVGDGVGPGDGVGAGLFVGAGVEDGVGVGSAVGDGVGMGVGVGVGLGSAVGDERGGATAPGCPSGHGVDDGVGVGSAVGDGVGCRGWRPASAWATASRSAWAARSVTASGQASASVPERVGAASGCGIGWARTIQSAALSFESAMLPSRPPGRRSIELPAGGAGAAPPSTKALVASPQPTASITWPPTWRRTTAPPVAARPPLYVASAAPAWRPRPFAISTWRPGSTRSDPVQAALRVTVAPEALAYTISRPARSSGAGPAFATSMYSSDAEAPPVTISATRRPWEAGHPTDDVAAIGSTGAGGGEPRPMDAIPSRTTSTPVTALRGARMDDLRAGLAGGRDARCVPRVAQPPLTAGSPERRPPGTRRAAAGRPG